MVFVSGLATRGCGVGLHFCTPRIGVSEHGGCPGRSQQAHRHPRPHPDDGLRSPSGPPWSSLFRWVVAIDAPERPSLCVHWPTATSPRRVRLPGVPPQSPPNPSLPPRTVSCSIVCPLGRSDPVFPARTAASVFCYGSLLLTQFTTHAQSSSGALRNGVSRISKPCSFRSATSLATASSLALASTSTVSGHPSHSMGKS